MQLAPRPPGAVLLACLAPALTGALSVVRQGDPPFVVAKSCSGCLATVNFRCEGMRNGRDAPYYRIAECLLPLYGLIEVARDFIGKGNTGVCAVTWLDEDSPSIEHFLTEMARVPWFKIINEGIGCSRTLLYHGANRTESDGASEKFVQGFGTGHDSWDRHLLKAYPVDLAKNLQLIQEDASSMVGVASPHVVIIQRRGKRHMFHDVSVDQLSDSLAHSTGLPTTTYHGCENVVDTVRMFNQAAGIVGYYGSGWANILFSAHPHCNHQISTFEDLKDEKRWRISEGILMTNPQSDWHFYHLPLKLLLEENMVTGDVFERVADMDYFIDNFPWVPLRGVDIADLASQMGECVKDKLRRWPSAGGDLPTNPESGPACGGLLAGAPPSMAEDAATRAPARRPPAEAAAEEPEWVEVPTKDLPAPELTPAGAPVDAGYFSEPDTCWGCEFTVNMRCEGQRSGRYAPYHRIVDCLLPMYGMIELAHEASRNSSAKVCAITWMDENMDDLALNVLPFLTDLSGINWYKLIDEKGRCFPTVKYHAAYRTRDLGASNQYLATFGSDNNMIRAHAIDVKMNLERMQQDASRMVGERSPRIVLIQREGQSRLFAGDTVEQLKTSLGQGTGLPVMMYYGSESVADTIKMFNQASGIVGYHGAAWANALFSAHRHCSEHITTFMDLEDKEMWRINKDLELNPLGKFHAYTIPLKLLLADNHVAQSVFQEATDKDHFIKDLAWVPLRSDDITQLTSLMTACLLEWAEAGGKA